MTHNFIKFLKSQLQALLINTAVLFMTVLLCFGGFELFLRHFKLFDVSSVAEGCNIVSPNPSLMYELQPHCDDINGWGMRDNREYELTSKKYRIAVIGDSIAYGSNIPADKTFSRELENAINDINNVKSVEVLNFGVPGYSTVQEVEMLKTKALKFHPDVVILQYFLNDDEIYTTIMHGLLQDLRHARLDGYETALDPSQSKLLRFLAGTRTMIGLRYMYSRLFTPPQPRAEFLNESQWADVRENVITKYYADRDPVSIGMSRLKVLSKKYQFPVLVVVFPYAYSHLADYPEQAVPEHEMAMRKCKEQGFYCLDILQEIRDDPTLRDADGSKFFSDDYCHPSEEGHKLAARFILKALKTHRLLPPQKLP